MYKYPRTPHLEGSGIQRGDEDIPIHSLHELANKYIVVEEKMDGANCAISFSNDSTLLLQSRGHYLTGGPRETQFHLFKSWAYTHMTDFWSALTDRYILYGEWLYAKHTVFYTNLPHYFMEFDIYDKHTNTFLSTAQRQNFLTQLPYVVSVKVLYQGYIQTQPQLESLIGPSYFIGADHLNILRTLCHEKQLDYAQVLQETDQSLQMEGLYIKVEQENIVSERYKFVRGSFLQALFDSESHWMNRPLLPNRLRQDVILF
jgi:hypothetical protein